MTAPLALVTVHHEGAGDPTDVPRGAAGGYTYWIGPTKWTRLRSPYESFATLHFNHVSVDVCLSGNRDNTDITQHDLDAMRAIAQDSRARAELIRTPLVRQHRQTFNTDCPGTKTVAKWSLIPRTFTVVVPTPAPPHPAHRTLAPGATGPDVVQLQHELNVGTGTYLKADGLFGPSTQAAVFGFQAYFHLAVDGIVGPKTWTMLDYCYKLKGGR